MKQKKMASSTVVTDDELRRRLLEYGENFPVTASNRGILLAKLKRLDAEEGKSNSARNKRSLLSFSSSEDSESERGGARSVNNNASFATPTSASVRKTRRSRVNDVAQSSTLSTSGSRRRASTAVHTNNFSGESTGTAVAPSSASGSGGGSGRASLGSSNSTSRHALSSKVTRSTRSSTSSRRSLSAAARPSNLDISESDASDSSMSNIPENRDVSEFPRSRRSMYADWVGTSSTSTATLPSNVARGGGTAIPVSPPSFPSSGLRWSTSPRALNGNHDSTAGEFLQVQSDGINGIDSNDESQTNSSQCISMVLLAVVAMFFFIIAVIYLGAQHRDLVPYLGFNSEIITNVSPVCNLRSGETCLVGDIANSLKDTLRTIAGDAECSTRSDNPNARRMPIEEAERRIKSLAGSHLVFSSDVLLMFSRNPLWGVRLLREDGTAVPSTEITRVRWLESAISNVPMMCRLKLAFLNTVFKSAVILAVFFAVVILGYLTYVIVEWKRKEREEVFALVEKILDILQDHARACQGDPKKPPYLAIPHVRDMLMPPAARRSGRRIWDKAVDFILNNESRVRFEVQCVEGEDFQVWRWLQPDSRTLIGGKSSVTNKSPRIWQGQAFETLESGMNALHFSPTPCLKVRNMFDPDVEYEDDWPIHIQDAILEKCIDSDIVHLRVDACSHEGCVYIKCKDSATAGTVYRALHGWWFDGKLVTVKYLRLERYHERFPDAANCFRFLRPNTTTSSMRMRNRSATFAYTAS